MRNDCLSIALMGEDVLKRTFPTTITAHARSLILVISEETIEHDLARLIGACCHLRHLYIVTHRVLQIASCIPRPLDELSYIHLRTQKSVSPGLLALIRLVPNVRQIDWLPPTSEPLDEELSAMGPLALHSLHLYWIINTSVLLTPLLMNRWSVRTLTLSIEPAILQRLRLCGVSPGTLPATQELTFIINDLCKDETDPLHALIAACNLRSLDVQASAEKTTRLLAAALGTCGGLRALTLDLEDLEDPEAVQEFAATLVSTMPRALRSLELFVLPECTPMYDALRSICRSRRIILHVRGP